MKALLDEKGVAYHKMPTFGDVRSILQEQGMPPDEDDKKAAPSSRPPRLRSPAKEQPCVLYIFGFHKNQDRTRSHSPHHSLSSR